VKIRAYNRAAWDRQVEYRNPWTVPVAPETIAAARRGEWEIFLTPTRPVPREWFPVLRGCRVLCLASGGGQQGPVLAVAGAQVTVLDNSPAQLAQDRRVAERDQLDITLVEGDMADLGIWADGTFELIVHPISNCFAPAVRPVWAEAFRVLQPGGVLLSGFVNPAVYLFDDDLAQRTGVLQVTHTLPYADVVRLSDEQRKRYIEAGTPFEFSHSLEDQIGGQLDAGFILTGLYEDGSTDDDADPLARYMPLYVATRAVKPPEGS
jgi:SAM-dependent methyltransferase